MLSDFHFLSPEWFFTLLPLAAILWGMGRGGTGTGAWQRVVDPTLLPHLLVQGGGRGRRLPLALLAAGWVAVVAALANPTFERLPVPVFRGELARVVVLDLSRSMESRDLEPSRLTRARYKVADILERSRDGQVALIAFAGDAFVVSPLTDDADTIEAMLDALVPEIMPVQGSRPDLAIAKAQELLTQAGASGGEVVLVSDGTGGPRAQARARALSSAGHRLSVIGVGTKEGAPVPGVIDEDEGPVIARLDADSMRELATAGGGVYAPLSVDGRDLDSTLRVVAELPDQRLEEAQASTEVWSELGPWILLAVLPFGALAFRRGWLLAAALVFGNWVLVPEPAMALTWDDLWQRRDQQAAAALERGEHETALGLAQQPQRRGAASYRLGDFEAAAEAFAAEDEADDHYNRGNALARSGRLEEALTAYEQALDREPNMEDALYNKALIEDLLEQQEEQEQQEQQPQREGQQEEEGEESQDQSQDDQGNADQPRQGEPSDGDSSEDAGAEQQEPEGQSGEQESDEQEQGSAAPADETGEQEQEQEQGNEPSQASREQSASGGSRDDDSQQEADSDAAEAQDPDDIERAAADYRDQAAEHLDGQTPDAAGTSAQEPGEEAPSAQEREERQAADQWLRRIPDDPAGLLRRKFLYQYRSRAEQEGEVVSGDAW